MQDHPHHIGKKVKREVARFFVRNFPAFTYRETTPFEASFERDLSRKPPVAPPRRKVETKRVEAPPTRNTTVTFESTTPWNATGFYYSPRYPQSHRGKNYYFTMLQKLSKCEVKT